MTMINVSQEDIEERCYGIISIIDKKRADLDEKDAQKLYDDCFKLAALRSKYEKDSVYLSGIFESKPLSIEVCRRMTKHNNNYIDESQYNLCKTLVHAIENGRKIVAISATDYRMIFE